MSPNHLWGSRGLIAATAIALCTLLAGCAGTRTAHPEVPNQQVLDPATQALDKAVNAHANQFAPHIIDSARRRITIARDILFTAAEADRPLTDAEQSRVHTLVEQARLDARAALVKTQARVVQQQIVRLQGHSGASQQSDNGATNANSPPTGDAGDQSSNSMSGGAQ